MMPQCNPSRQDNLTGSDGEPETTVISLFLALLIVAVVGAIVVPPLVSYSGPAIEQALADNGVAAYTFLFWTIVVTLAALLVAAVGSQAFKLLHQVWWQRERMRLRQEAALLQLAQTMPTSGWSHNRLLPSKSGIGYGAYERQLLPAKSEEWHDCGRCDKPQNDNEVCWYCHDYLCRVCWDEHGHCGHEEAEAFLDTAFVLEVGDGGISLSTDD